MKHIFVRRVIGVCCTAVVVTAAYGQGLYWESTTGGTMAQGKDVPSKFYYMPKKFKTVINESGDAVIVRIDREVVMTLNAGDKTYSEMTFAELETAAGKSRERMDSHMEEIQKQMAALPEEQRKMMEQMMGDRMEGKGKDGKVKVRKTGEKRSVSGFTCTKYIVSQGGEDMITVWVTKDVPDFRAMKKDMEEFSRRMAALSPAGSASLVEGMKSIDGFPIETEVGRQMKTVVTKIERRSTPAEEFEVPAGYSLVPSPMIEGEIGGQ
jgi:hypothetical protein